MFVIGASGKIGSATVSVLSSKYRDVVEIRAGVRHPDSADHLKSLAGVAVIKACMGSPDLVETFKGVDRLYIVTPATEDRAQLAVSTAESAKTAGVQYVAIVTSPVAENPNTVFSKQYNPVETKMSTLGISYTIIRLPFFVENLYGFKDVISSQSTITYFLDPTTKFAQIVVEDAGKASAAILANPSKYANRTLELTSDINSYNDIVKELSRALGKEVKYIQLPVDTAVAALEQQGWPTWQAKGVIEVVNILNNAKSPRGDVSIYESITGEKPTDLKTWVDNHASAF